MPKIEALVNTASSSEIPDMIRNIVELAKTHIGSRSWAYYHITPYFGPKCGMFVGLILTQVGIPLTWVLRQGKLFTYTRPPLACHWEDRSVDIPGWQFVSGVQPGDIIAHGGHVGIVSGEQKSISVSSLINLDFGKVVENDWGFRARQQGKVVLRRYVGLPA